MRASDLKKFEKMLIDMKKDLQEKLKELEEKIDENPLDSSFETNPYPIHLSDLGTDEEIRESNAELYARLSEKLKDVEYALIKIRDKTYGICENCGGEISVKRLKALPFTRYCLKCAEILRE
uniref:Zinc finger DksA/TraR C4-type domain-containing protein n=1 Tax=candidate division WOR-3 bacterium TaxID=2052148 RepID=A0A7C4U6Y7_UNCW3